MLDHITSTLHDLLSKYKHVEIVLGGDRNKLDLTLVFNNVPGLRQSQTQPTHKLKTIEFIATSMWQLYKQATVVNPIDVDVQGQANQAIIRL